MLARDPADLAPFALAASFHRALEPWPGRLHCGEIRVANVIEVNVDG